MLCTEQRRLFAYLKVIRSGKFYSYPFFYSHLSKTFLFFFKRKIISLSSDENILRKLYKTKNKITRPIAGLENMENCFVEKAGETGSIELDKVFRLVI